MPDKFSPVAAFMRLHHIPLPERDWDNYRLVPDGTYTHTTLPYGVMRHGITNGVIGYFECPLRRPPDDGVTPPPVVGPLHLSNLRFQPDVVPVYTPPKAKRPAAPDNLRPVRRREPSAVTKLLDELL